MSDALIIDACRTPRGIGKQGKGALAHLHPQHLAATVLSAIRDRNDLNTAEVDDIIWGTSSQRGAQGADLHLDGPPKGLVTHFDPLERAPPDRAEPIHH